MDLQNPIELRMEEVKVSDALSKLVLAKEAAKRRAAYIKALRYAIKSFICIVGDIAVRDLNEGHVEAFLSEKAQNPSSRQTYVSRLSALFEFARRKRWMQENPCFFLERVTLDQKEPEILTPEEAEKILWACDMRCPRAKPWLILCLYAGLRPEEAAAVTWDRIDLQAGRITVSSETSKVRRKRFVEAPGIAFKLLSECSKVNTLPIVLSTRKRAMMKIKSSMGWAKWPKDILRHSCASYWLALVEDAQKVSLQLGNSPQILLKHYAKAVTKDQAEEFFHIKPTQNPSQ